MPQSVFCGFYKQFSYLPSQLSLEAAVKLESFRRQSLSSKADERSLKLHHHRPKAWCVIQSSNPGYTDHHEDDLPIHGYTIVLH